MSPSAEISYLHPEPNSTILLHDTYSLTSLALFEEHVHDDSQSPKFCVPSFLDFNCMAVFMVIIAFNVATGDLFILASPKVETFPFHHDRARPRDVAHSKPSLCHLYTFENSKHLLHLFRTKRFSSDYTSSLERVRLAIHKCLIRTSMHLWYSRFLQYLVDSYPISFVLSLSILSIFFNGFGHTLFHYLPNRFLLKSPGRHDSGNTSTQFVENL
ncbi:hypothetical protein Tco_0409906 [Tanacetum coccineum]